MAQAVFGLGCLAFGLFSGRPVAAIAGVPLVAAFLWAWVAQGSGSGPGSGSGGVTVTEVAAGAADGDRAAVPDGVGSAGKVRGLVEVAGMASGVGATSGSAVVRLRVAAPGHRPVEALVVPGRPVEAAFTSWRTGRQGSFRVDCGPSGPFGLTELPVQRVAAPDRLVLPQAGVLRRVPVPNRLRGLSGARRSTRRGEGMDLQDIDLLGPGVRRIDWRTTAKRSPDLAQVYARRTLASAEAAGVLVIDSRDDLGPDLHTWTGLRPARVDEAASLDLARHAAASVARALIAAGDRVGFTDLGRRRRTLPAAAGQRHLRRVLYALALAEPRDREEDLVSSQSLHVLESLALAAPGGEVMPKVRPPAVTAGAIVYLFTTLVDDEPMHLVRAWLETGHRVVVVDTLPPVRPVAERNLRLAWRIVTLERAGRVQALRAHGVPVVRWAAEGQAELLDAAARAAERGRSMTSTGGGVR
ncbi:MAG: DUF58 domain-containing protein [Bifidobacteriaceae bacterium]|nr:DUF58 domain-containing protein [Bifidobacteriaceae bacterium]